MSKICIPEVEDVLTLTKAWKFKLYPERRNLDLWHIFFPETSQEDLSFYHSPEWKEREIACKTASKNGTSVEWWKHQNAYEQKYLKRVCRHVTLKAGVDLRVDRIYIRKGLSEFSSLSFWILNAEFMLPGCTTKTRTVVRYRYGTSPLKKKNERLLATKERYNTYTKSMESYREVEITLKAARSTPRFWAKLEDVNNICYKEKSGSGN